MWIFIFFNFAVVFLCTWLYLGGARKIKGLVSLKERKEKKEVDRRQKGEEV